MVYCGKPSRGCENCRKLHKKCDEAHPACSRCVRTKRTCRGYRDQSDLMFRNETIRTQAKFHRCDARTRGSESTPAVKTLLLGSLREYDACMATLGRLSPSTEDRVVCHFYHTTLDNLSNEDPVRFLHSQLPNLFSKSDTGSALRLATEAISYASSLRLVKEAAVLSRKRYAQALRSIGTAIQDPMQAQNDQTLYAILLLSGYETMLRDQETPPAWGAHFDGAAALLKLRIGSEMHSPLSRSMFGFIRKGIVLGHIQACKPIDEVFSLPSLTASQESPEDDLIAKAAKIPSLQYQSTCLFAGPREPSRNDVESLFHRAQALEIEISEWARTLTRTWAYSAAMNLDDPGSSQFTLHQVHRYSDHYTARVWNFYRVSRLILKSIINRVTVWLSASDDQRFDEGQDEGSTMLVNDICASVPFLMGHDLSKMKLPSTSEGRKGEGMGWPRFDANVPRQAGRFSLIWPLYVAGGCLSVPQAQRDWIRTQLLFLAEHGETQAQFAYFTNSQILGGRADDVRFDCI